MAQDSIGLIGVGLLGSALAERFLHFGKNVIGFDLSAAQRDRLRELGGSPVPASEEVARQCERIVLSLPTSAVVAEVLRVITPQLAKGAIIIDTTTGDPDEMESFSRRLAEAGIEYLDATVGGSSEQARSGESIVMVGGKEETWRRCEDIFSSFSSHAFYVGPSGSGARMKLVMNLALGLNRAVLGEALGFASACGVDPEMALDVLKAGPAYSRVMDIKGAKMLQRDYSPQARLSQHLKDVRLILEMGQRSGAKLPLSHLHQELLSILEERGYGDNDNSAVVEAFL